MIAVTSCRVLPSSYRYKVKMEIHLKQREVEQRPVATLSALSSSHRSFSHGMVQASHSTASSTMTLPSALERALSQGNLTHTNIYQSEVEKLQAQLQEKETKWRTAYEKLAKELDQLKTKGAESVVAAQWRLRYEGCLRDKEDLQARLSLYQQLSSEVTEHGQSIEELYVELQEEYKVTNAYLSLRLSLCMLIMGFVSSVGFTKTFTRNVGRIRLEERARPLVAVGNQTVLGRVPHSHRVLPHRCP